MFLSNKQTERIGFYALQAKLMVLARGTYVENHCFKESTKFWSGESQLQWPGRRRTSYKRSWSKRTREQSNLSKWMSKHFLTNFSIKKCINIAAFYLVVAQRYKRLKWNFKMVELSSWNNIVINWNETTVYCNVMIRVRWYWYLLIVPLCAAAPSPVENPWSRPFESLKS